MNEEHELDQALGKEAVTSREGEVQPAENVPEAIRQLSDQEKSLAEAIGVTRDIFWGADDAVWDAVVRRGREAGISSEDRQAAIGAFYSLFNSPAGLTEGRDLPPALANLCETLPGLDDLMNSAITADRAHREAVRNLLTHLGSERDRFLEIMKTYREGRERQSEGEGTPAGRKG